MKSNVALHYAVFQLTPSRNRCELVVVRGEETERLASGLLKPFLVHLKVAEDQYNTGTKEIKLKPPPVYGDWNELEASAWFTKGTIERFVRFVSTPEVLERVGTVEAELLQLEGAIRDHANEHIRVDASQPRESAITSAASNILLSPTTDQAPTPTPSRQNSLDGAQNPSPDETARLRLLRAMEARKMLLHKEQGMAIARATAAGFDMQKMEHLLVFANCFGASRLGDACVMYTGIFKKRKESGLWDEWPLSDTTSLRNVPTSPELLPREFDLGSDTLNEAGGFRLDDLKNDVNVTSYSNYYSEDLVCRSYSGADIFQKLSLFEQSPTLSPNKARILSGECIQGYEGFSQRAGNEGPPLAQGQEASGRVHGDDSSLNRNGTGRWPPSLSSFGIRYAADNAGDSKNDVDAGHQVVQGQRQRRAWGPPQFLTHQIALGSQSKSGPLSSGSDTYHMTLRVNHLNHIADHCGRAAQQRPGESLPSWVIEAGQPDQPWHPGPTEPEGQALSCALVSQLQTHMAVNGHAQRLSTTEQNKRPLEENGKLLQYLTTPGQKLDGIQAVEVQRENMENYSSAPSAISASHSTIANKDQETCLVPERVGERPQSQSVVRRASSPRRRSSSPMCRVQVGRNSVRRSGVKVVKSVSLANAKATGCSKMGHKDVEAHDEEKCDPRDRIASPLSPDHAAIEDQSGHGWRDGLCVGTEFESSTSVAQSSQTGWTTPVNNDMIFSSNACECTSTGPFASAGLLVPKEPKGRFYEQYCEKRDAKLREESDWKKAERDAKLKCMQEVLERRKAEMALRIGRVSGKQVLDGETRIEKFHSLKSDLTKSKKLKDDHEPKRLEEISIQQHRRNAARSSLSSVGVASSKLITSPLQAATNDHPTLIQPSTLSPTASFTPSSRLSIVRRLSPSKKISTGPCRGTLSSTSVHVSAPKLTRTSQIRPQIASQSKELENLMSRSVPSLAELRKENTKPSLVRNGTYTERPRNIGGKLSSSSGPLSPIASQGGHRGPSPDDNNCRMSVRKTYAVVMDSMKVSPNSAPYKELKGPPAEKNATSKSSKRLPLALASRAEPKPFLRKGRGIGPGAGTIVRKSKVAAAPEPTKLSEEEAEKEHEYETQVVKVEAEADGGEEKALTLSGEMDEQASVQPNPTLTRSSQSSESWAAPGTSFRISGSQPQTLSLDFGEGSDAMRQEDRNKSEATPESLGRCPSCETDQYAHTELVLMNGHPTNPRHVLNESPEDASSICSLSVGSGVPPPCMSPPLHSKALSSLSPRGSEVSDVYRPSHANVSASPGDTISSPWIPLEVSSVSMLEALPILEAPCTLASDSPFLSPALPQLQQSIFPEDQENSRIRKKLESLQKAAAPPAVKDSPRGLKRLLKFGRKKDKSSTTSTTSDSPSDIDDDLDVGSELDGRTDELSHTGAKSTGLRMPGWTSGLMGPPAIPENSATESYGGTRLISIPFVRSSIPAAPAHFKTRDDHIGGSSLLKAPRSFFSLSSFRSKGKQ